MIQPVLNDELLKCFITFVIWLHEYSCILWWAFLGKMRPCASASKMKKKFQERIFKVLILFVLACRWPRADKLPCLLSSMRKWYGQFGPIRVMTPTGTIWMLTNDRHGGAPSRWFPLYSVECIFRYVDSSPLCICQLCSMCVDFHSTLFLRYSLW